MKVSFNIWALYNPVTAEHWSFYESDNKQILLCNRSINLQNKCDGDTVCFHTWAYWKIWEYSSLEYTCTEKSYYQAKIFLNLIFRFYSDLRNRSIQLWTDFECMQMHWLICFNLFYLCRIFKHFFRFQFQCLNICIN